MHTVDIQSTIEMTFNCTPKCTMSKDISIKEFRAHLADIADRVEKGEAFRVIRRSKPAFYVVKMTEDSPEEEWETIIDFTEGGKTKGAPIKKVLRAFKELKKEHG